jgi:hypothetical protein
VDKLGITLSFKFPNAKMLQKLDRKTKKIKIIKNKKFGGNNFEEHVIKRNTRIFLTTSDARWKRFQKLSKKSLTETVFYTDQKYLP